MVKALKNLIYILSFIIIALLAVAHFHNTKVMVDNFAILSSKVSSLEKMVEQQSSTINTLNNEVDEYRALNKQIASMSAEIETNSALVEELSVTVDELKIPDPIVTKPATVNRGEDRSLVKIDATVTTYHLGECGKAPSHPEYGITASGRPVREWYTCAGAPMFPFGTVLYIPYFDDAPNRGVFVVEDRGGAVVNNGRYGPCIDIYVNNSEYVDEFGGKALEVYVLKMGN